MKIRIGSLEIVDLTMEELDELIERYGGTTLDESTPGPREARPTDPAQNGNGNALSAVDPVLLRRLVDAGDLGCPTREIGEMLGRQGKATRRAARAWAQRVGLASDDKCDPFDDCRVGTQRGIKIKPSLIGVAEALLKRR